MSWPHDPARFKGNDAPPTQTQNREPAPPVGLGNRPRPRPQVQAAPGQPIASPEISPTQWRRELKRQASDPEVGAYSEEDFQLELGEEFSGSGRPLLPEPPGPDQQTDPQPLGQQAGGGLTSTHGVKPRRKRPRRQVSAPAGPGVTPNNYSTTFNYEKWVKGGITNRKATGDFGVYT